MIRSILKAKSLDQAVHGRTVVADRIENDKSWRMYVFMVLTIEEVIKKKSSGGLFMA